MAGICHCCKQPRENMLKHNGRWYGSTCYEKVVGHAPSPENLTKVTHGIVVGFDRDTRRPLVEVAGKLIRAYDPDGVAAVYHPFNIPTYHLEALEAKHGACWWEGGKQEAVAP